MKKYTKSDLEAIICTQQENLTVIQDFLGIIKHQNELLRQANQRLRDQIAKME